MKDPGFYVIEGLPYIFLSFCDTHKAINKNRRPYYFPSPYMWQYNWYELTRHQYQTLLYRFHIVLFGSTYGKKSFKMDQNSSTIPYSTNFTKGELEVPFNRSECLWSVSFVFNDANKHMDYLKIVLFARHCFESRFIDLKGSLYSYYTQKKRG